MNTFFNYIQPTIVRASYDEEVPEHLRGRFFINFNVFGIKYFEEQYVLTEGPNGFQYLVTTENPGGAVLTEYDPIEEVLETNNIIDIPRIYIDITDYFVNDRTNLFKSFVYQAIVENAIWCQGIDNFLAGREFYINYTLYNYLASVGKLTNPDFSIRLHNYLDHSANISKYWMDLSNEPYKDYTDLEYFNEKNKLLDNTFSEDELNNFYSTFCGLILKHTKISDEKRSTQRNNIYDQVLHYYANFMTDAGSAAIASILNSMYTYTDNSQKCGCGKTTDETITNTQTCYDMYKAAMSEWLVTMLSDPEFYNDWFIIDLGSSTYLANEVLTGYIEDLIREFINMQNLLMFNKSTKSLNCTCPTVSVDENDCNYGVIQNYMNVMTYVNNMVIKENKNKIKIYGGNFGKLLPKLQF